MLLTVLWLPTVGHKSWPCQGCAAAAVCPNPKVPVVALMCHHTGGGGHWGFPVSSPWGCKSWLCPAITGLHCGSCVTSPRRSWHWPPISRAKPLLSPTLPSGGPELEVWPSIPRASCYCTPHHPWAKDTVVPRRPRPVLLLASPIYTHTHTHTHSRGQDHWPESQRCRPWFQRRWVQACTSDTNITTIKNTSLSQDPGATVTDPTTTAPLLYGETAHQTWGQEG